MRPACATSASGSVRTRVGSIAPRRAMSDQAPASSRSNFRARSLSSEARHTLSSQPSPRSSLSTQTTTPACSAPCVSLCPQLLHARMGIANVHRQHNSNNTNNIRTQSQQQTRLQAQAQAHTHCDVCRQRQQRTLTSLIGMLCCICKRWLTRLRTMTVWIPSFLIASPTMMTQSSLLMERSLSDVKWVSCLCTWG